MIPWVQGPYKRGLNIKSFSDENKDEIKEHLEKSTWEGDFYAEKIMCFIMVLVMVVCIAPCFSIDTGNSGH